MFFDVEQNGSYIIFVVLFIFRSNLAIWENLLVEIIIFDCIAIVHHALDEQMVETQSFLNSKFLPTYSLFILSNRGANHSKKRDIDFFIS